jgi:2-keto-3-deoxy-L-rhamnonate aldolase RhmA
LGIYVSLADVSSIELAKKAGFDFVRLDCEYMPYDFSKVAEMIRTANNVGLLIMVRVARLEDLDMILNFGADGIVVPDCNTVERAKEAISRIKYYPIGARAMYSGARAVRNLDMSFPEYCKVANDRVMLNIQVEDIKAMEYIDEMLSLEGIDMVSSGRGDISQSLGVPGHTDDPRIDEMESALIKKSHEYGKIPVMLTTSKAKVDDYIKQGLRMITVGKDEGLLFTAMKDCVKKMRG